MPSAALPAPAASRGPVLASARPRRRRPAGVVLLCAVALGGLAGCRGYDDPYARVGTWRPEGLNDENIAAMVADTRHLQQGVNNDTSPGVLSNEAVHRLLTDHVKDLPTTQLGPVPRTNQVGATGGAGATGAGGI